MGMCSNCFNKPEQQTPVSAPTAGTVIYSPRQLTPSHAVEEVINSLKTVSDTIDLNKFVHIIKQLLEEKSNRGSTSKSAKEEKGSTSESANEKRDMWTLFISSGAKFLKLVNDHMEKIEDKQDIFYSGNSRVVAEILGQIGQLHWAVGGLAITAYLLEKFDKVSANKAEALDLLSKMVDLATTVIDLKDVIPKEEERLKKAVMLLVQASIMSVSQIHSKKIFRFFKTSVNSENLKEMSNTLNHLYRDLTLAISTTTAKRQLEIAENQSKVAKRHSRRQLEMAERQSIVLPVPKPFYPKSAVGIENAREDVIKLLNITTEDESTLVVVIYGFGGIGKTTLANAVIAVLNLDGYNYARIQLDEDKSKNDLKEMQELILKDAFPDFHWGASLKLRDCQEGRNRLKQAFQCTENKPLFLFIDNALRSEDLKQLLPEDLSDLPKRSKIFLTTRKLDQTDVFLPLRRRSFAMKTLEKDDAEIILCKDPDNRELIKDDMERILRICGGVPLALKIVGGHLVKMGYNAGKCSQILDALEKGGHVKEENLSGRLINFVYNGMEDGTKDAFLDICCIFNGWLRRHVEYVVGAQEVKSLEEAALLTPFVDDRDLKTIYGVMDTIYAGEERLKVHDIVRAKGRSMSASSRLTDAEFFCEAAQDEMKLNAIKGLWFEDEDEYIVDIKHLYSMRHSLRIMHLEGATNTRTSAQSPMKFKELRYLSIPWVLPMKVEEHDMLRMMLGPTNGMRIKQLPKRLSFLYTDDLDSCSTQGIQNHSLEELCLLEGPNMKQLPEGLHQLSSLKILSLCWFNEMEEFPKQVCKLSSLTKLGIFAWKRLKRLPQSFGRLKGLTHLEIFKCDVLEELPYSFGELTTLEHLSLLGCSNLKQELPSGLESLKYLNVFSCEQLSVESYKSKVDLWIEDGGDDE